MIFYYARQALSAFRTRRSMSMLLVLAIALGAAATATMSLVVERITAAPLPALAGQLYYPHLDPLPKTYHFNPEWGDPSTNFTWPDAMALLRAPLGGPRAVMAGAELVVEPGGHRAPFRARGRYVTRQFFRLFGLHFTDGAVWGGDADASGLPRVVLTGSLARRLFGRTDVVGRYVTLGRHVFAVVGVVPDWAPQPLFYGDAVGRGGFGRHDRFFLPLQAAVKLRLATTNTKYGWGEDDGPTSPTESWLQVWVRLESARDVARYQAFLRAYSAVMLHKGVYQRPPSNARLYRLDEWLQQQHLVPPELLLQFRMSLIFLATCLVNVTALLLAVNMERQREFGIRRALGASRWQVVQQLVVESLVLALPAGALGAVITWIGLVRLRQHHPMYAALAHLDLGSVGLVFAVSASIALAAALVPACRLASGAPGCRLREGA